MKYYSKNNLFYGVNLRKNETMVIPIIEDVTINDVIEPYEISRYFIVYVFG